MLLKIEQVEIDGKIQDIYCKDGIISDNAEGTAPAEVLDGRGKIAVPSFKNGHTHSAMTLLRGYGDDMTLHKWLTERIFPAEDRYTGEMIYWGTKLACLEAIKGGTTFLNDMYFQIPESWRAYEESGIKAANCIGIVDMFDSAETDRRKKMIREAADRFGSETGRVRLGLGLHAIYTNSDEMIEWTAEFARETGLPIHMHLSETQKEVDDCIAKHGKRPTEYLKERGILGDNILFAHAIWLTEKEMNMLAEAGSTVVHNPVSNMKLVSDEVFPMAALQSRGIPMMLGTDSPASNNNIDMMEEMKVAALLQKHQFKDPTLGKAETILKLAQGGYASFFPGLGSSLAPGEPADMILLDKDQPEMVPFYNQASTLVYASPRNAVDTVICDGRVLMKNRKVPGEEEILAKCRELAKIYQ